MGSSPKLKILNKRKGKDIEVVIYHGTILKVEFNFT